MATSTRNNRLLHHTAAILSVKWYQLILMCCLVSCARNTKTSGQAIAMNERDTGTADLPVGAITYQKGLDDPDFKLCYPEGLVPYYQGSGSIYRDPRRDIHSYFDSLKLFSPSRENGYLNVRFIVNCEGKAGRFRPQGMDGSLREAKTDSGFTAKVIAAIKAFDNWKQLRMHGGGYDYSNYLNFKLKDGKIEEITP